MNNPFFDNQSNDQHDDITSLEEITEARSSQACYEELQRMKEKYAYLASDLENVRRRADRERVHVIRSTQERMLRDMLKVVDDLERALSQLSKTTESYSEQCAEGITLVKRNFEQMLEKYGVTVLAQIDYFDPHIHEAIAQVHQEGAASGKIVEVFEKGYMLNGELLRPARVSVVA